MSLGTLNSGLAPASVGSVTMSVTLTNPTDSSTTLLATIGDPSSGTLQTWDLYYREVGAESWIEYATGLTEATQNIGDLDASKSYEAYAVGHVLVDVTTSTSSADTAEQVGPAMSLWAFVEGGQDFGSSIEGGGVWFWNAADPGTFEGNVKNLEPESMDAVQTWAESVSATSGSILGWGFRVGATWDTEVATYTPDAGGTVPAPKIVPTSVLDLTTPLAQDVSGRFQVVHSPGTLAAAKTFANTAWPESTQAGSANFSVGNYLGSDAPTFIDIGPLQSRIALRRASGSSTYYNFAIFGDSTTASVRPVGSTNDSAKEGFSYEANKVLRTGGKRVRIYSWGQGAATWAEIQQRVVANLPYLVGKVSHLSILVWSWNSAYNSSAEADTAWAEYLALEAAVEAAGFACSPMILHPYTTRNSSGQVEGFTAMKAHVTAHPRGILMDELMGDTSWPDLPALESEDNVHQNATGSIRTGSGVASTFLAQAVAYYPELA